MYVLVEQTFPSPCMQVVAGTMRRPPSPTVSGSGKGGDDNNTGSVKKGPWTPEEDKRLVDYIQKHGHGSWRALPKLAGLNRCGKSCRLRWTNYLRPDIKRGKFTEEEEQLVIKLHSVIGNKWSTIATQLPGRTDNEIKNHWNTHLRKRLLQMGIDPTTHRPRTDINFINALANLPHLLALAASFGSNNSVPTNPFWDSINTLRLCPDAVHAQIANELQLLQNSDGAQARMPGLTAQFGCSNQLLDHLELLNSSIPEVQIPHPGILLNETNQGKTDTIMNISSSISSLNIPSGGAIPGNPMFPMLISAPPLLEHPPSSSIDWIADKKRCAPLGSIDNISAATMFEAWRDIKMADEKGIDLYSTYWQDI